MDGVTYFNAFILPSLVQNLKRLRSLLQYTFSREHSKGSYTVMQLIPHFHRLKLYFFWNVLLNSTDLHMIRSIIWLQWMLLKSELEQLYKFLPAAEEVCQSQFMYLQYMPGQTM